MKVFNNKFYIIGFLSLVIMGGVVIYTFNTIFGSLTLAFEVETEIPESELRINRQNLDKAYSKVFEYEPTVLDVSKFLSQDLPLDEQDDEGESEGVEN